MRAVRAGMVTSIANPYWPLWWATAGLAAILNANELAAGRGLASGLSLSSFYVGHIFSDLVWYSFVSFMIATGRKLFTEKSYRILIAARSSRSEMTKFAHLSPSNFRHASRHK